ncbi:MAG: heme exporter protein CcmD [Pseudomonadota bacterium]
MGGYGTFVWGSYAVFTVILLWILAAPMVKKRTLMKELKQRQALARRRSKS